MKRCLGIESAPWVVWSFTNKSLSSPLGPPTPLSVFTGRDTSLHYKYYKLMLFVTPSNLVLGWNVNRNPVRCLIERPMEENDTIRVFRPSFFVDEHQYLYRQNRRRSRQLQLTKMLSLTTIAIATISIIAGGLYRPDLEVRPDATRDIYEKNTPF